MKTIKFLMLLLLMSFSAYRGVCQETVFTLLKSDLELADTYFSERKFQDALHMYLNVASKNPSTKEIFLKIARSNYFLKQYRDAVAAYEKYGQLNHSLQPTDIYYYAEAQTSISKYDKAVESYQNYLAKVPDDQLIIKKIWRLNNIQFLYEDSLHYAVREIPLNTGYGELCAAPYQGGIVFLSNRKGIQLVNKVDASLKTPFYRWYYSAILPDTTTRDSVIYNLPVIFNKEHGGKFHSGPLAFYERGQKMVFTSSGSQLGKKGGRTLRLYFAERKSGTWKVIQEFPYNSAEYSISDPTISGDGMVIYFSSDMKGFGGKDLYKSESKNGQWTKPENLGELVNTPYDEVFPHLHDRTLYFSSNGHAGMGGLDIFKIEISEKGSEEAENVGYPLNTNDDDFGIVIDSVGTHGYFSSNRKNGGYNDDIYEFDMDLQTYPLEISGVIKYKEHSWSDSLNLKVMPHAKVYLIDNMRNVTVHEGTSDAAGNFSIVIPYFSKYKIRVIGEDSDENIVSLEIPKHRRSYNEHEIVIVKDAFKSN